VQINTDDPRDLKAITIAAEAGQWLRCTSHDGRTLIGIPSQSQPATYHLVDVDAGTCDCQDFRRNGLHPGGIGHLGEHTHCKHLRAARFHLELVKAAQQRPARQRLRVVSQGGCEPA
jgi:hypothetical protein